MPQPRDDLDREWMLDALLNVMCVDGRLSAGERDRFAKIASRIGAAPERVAELAAEHEPEPAAPIGRDAAMEAHLRALGLWSGSAGSPPAWRRSPSP